MWCRPLFDEMAGKLVLYGRAMGLGYSESEDIVQDLFIQLLKRESPPDRPNHYCLRAFRNRALNYRKSLWRRIARELESIQWFESDPVRTDPREAAAMRGLRDLPVEQREVVVLKIWHGLTFVAIGEMLAISPNTAAGRYRYGLQKLRQALNGWNEDELGECRVSGELMDPSAGLKQA